MPYTVFIFFLFVAAMVPIVLWMLILRQASPKPKDTKNLAVKEPTDYTLTPSSTQWETEHFCKSCNASVSSKEWFARICNSCGTYDMGLYAWVRAYRKIWNGEKWIWQYKYGSTQFELSDKAL